VPLKFNDAEGYKEAIQHLGSNSNDFYRLLAQGTMKAAEQYGGEEFACVLGQEMGGYATGEVFFTSQAQGFRHSHLDSGGYSYDQTHEEKNVEKAVEFLMRDEQDRVLLTSMVVCLFAREVYTDELLAHCLNSLGYTTLADNMHQVAQHIQKLRWRLRLATGFDPTAVKIPKRFTEITTWKGNIDKKYLNNLKKEYAKRILELGKEEKKE
jgi:aldehyde:ferredoxin oxidoreductase